MESKYLLDELVEENRSIAYGIVQPGKQLSSGVPMIRVNNFEKGNLNVEEIMHIDPAIESKFSRTRLQGNEILLTLVGTIGQTALTDESMKGYNVARAVAVIPIKSTVNRKWIKYYIDSSITQQYFKEVLNTTVQATLNLKSVKATPIWMPEESYITKAVTILSDLDEKILINKHHINILLEQIHSLFNRCFNRFDFLGDSLHKKDELPIGWKNSSAYENILEIKQKNRENYEYPVLSVVKEGEFKVSEEIFTKQVYSKSTTNYKIVKKNQVAYNPARANIGSIAMLKEHDVGLVSPIYVVFETKETITPTYFYYYMKQPMFLESIKHHAIGTTRQNFPFEAFKMFPMIVPPMELQLEFEKIAKPIEEKIAKLKEENEVLAELRDTLLPKLMNGEISLEEGEKQ